MKSALFRTFVAFLLAGAVAFPQMAIAAGETEYLVRKDFNSLVPMFMEGHQNDLAWIKGYLFSGDIFIDGEVAGTVSGEAILWNPPLNLENEYALTTLRILNRIDGVGTVEEYGQATILGSPTTVTNGDILLAWMASLANGTGGLINSAGISAGTFAGNLYAGTGTATEVVQIRFGQ